VGKSLLAHALFHRFVSTSAIARNAPCPCGSGRRYKNCHGSLASANAAPTPDAVALDEHADRLFDRGDFAGAAHAYECLRAHRGLSAETLVRLGAALEKSGRLAYPSDTTRAPAGPPPPRAQLGLPEEGFVFCNFNASYKILPDMFAAWMRLLHAVPGSVLWLLDTNDSAKANLPRAAQRAGIAPERVRLATPVSPVDHVARNAAADLFLDTFPYGGHTTTNDALLAGLPVLTCAGDTLVSRIAGSQLRTVGLPELVARDLDDYETPALRLARNPNELATIRARLAANRRTEPLFDMARYAHDFEDRLLHIAREHAQSQHG
jgi:predicted O-linked N-acetylglucosamine transferase (SPINDLY family)